LASHKRKAYRDRWPIDPESAKPPQGWTGWPQGKEFAVVLTHDVDRARGHEKSARLMELEERYGFRSSFNFVPEDYDVSVDLRTRLADGGFEVGVHGLKHDGKLFADRSTFAASAARINGYLKEWNAVGFRAPAMHHNLEWLADLDVEYDSSTFDTDPFEPHSDSVGTIFPFWYVNKAGTRRYIEMPYTLPQDHCLFVILKEKDIRIWTEKLDWIARNGGLALLITHPDYMNFEGTSCRPEEYPARLYADFLEHLKTRYEGRYWHVLPRDLARFWRAAVPALDRPAESDTEGVDVAGRMERGSSPNRRPERGS
jgi:hypothetical protein